MSAEFRPVPLPRPQLELALVLAALALLAQACLVAAAMRAPRALPAAAAASLAPHQLAFEALPPPSLRVAQALLAAVDEVGLEAGSTGTWPAPEALAEAWLDPFTADHPLRWRADPLGPSCSYLGLPEEGGAAWILELAEGLPADADPSHAEALLQAGDHRRLADGRILHFKVWRRAEAPTQEGLPANPALAGWRQVILR